MSDVILRISSLSKYYTLTKALDKVSLEINRGEIHALCGENGAGKSTLIKLLTGAEEPSSGTIEFEGTVYKKLNPIESINMGISAIYQEFSLIPFLTVAENIFYGRDICKHGIRDINRMNHEASELCESMGIHMDVTSRVNTLGIAQQQIIEILKAVSRNCKFIIMDEPTAPLTLNETDIFFSIIRKLKEKHTTILFISHKLEEVFDICDRVTILCDGKLVATRDVNSIDKKQLIYYMVGRELSETYPIHTMTKGETILTLNNITNDSVSNISFDLHKGEILGLGGLVGAGRTEVARAIFGADPIKSGYMQLKGKKYLPKSPHSALQNGVGLIPEDRKTQGIISLMSVNENIVLASYKNFTKLNIIDKKSVITCSKKYVEELGVATPNIYQKIKFLSGGNQQKVVLAKILATECDILIFDEPTRGIDVGAKQEIYKLMCSIVDSGKSVIMISSEMQELIGMSDRILVMSQGKIVGELEKGEYTQEKILEMASIKTARDVEYEK